MLTSLYYDSTDLKYLLSTWTRTATPRFSLHLTRSKVSIRSIDQTPHTLNSLALAKLPVCCSLWNMDTGALKLFQGVSEDFISSPDQNRTNEHRLLHITLLAGVFSIWGIHPIFNNQFSQQRQYSSVHRNFLLGFYPSILDILSASIQHGKFFLPRSHLSDFTHSNQLTSQSHSSLITHNSQPCHQHQPLIPILPSPNQLQQAILPLL